MSRSDERDWRTRLALSQVLDCAHQLSAAGIKARPAIVTERELDTDDIDLSGALCPLGLARRVQTGARVAAFVWA